MMPVAVSGPFSARAPGAARVSPIKGLVFRELLKWYEETRGREETMRVYRTLPDELRPHLDPDRDCFGILARQLVTDGPGHHPLPYLRTSREDARAS